MDWKFKSPEEDCPEGYHVVDDDTICVPCTRICYKNMDHFTAYNCKRICPSVYNKLLGETILSTPSYDEESSRDHLWLIIIPVVCSLLVLVAIVISTVLCRRRRSVASGRKEMAIDSLVQQPVQETGIDRQRSELVPSGC